MPESLTILEGADATGKSSHAEWLYLRNPDSTVLLHYGKPSGEWRKEYFGRLAENPAAHTVLDRSFIGSRVWARCGFHPAPLDESAWRVVCWTYAAYGGRVSAHVVVRDWLEISDEIGSRGEPRQAAADAIAGQIRFLQLLARNEVYYIPIAAHTSNRLHYMRQG